jgi:hypothetical protein
MTFRMEMGRTKGELEALKETIFRARLVTGTMRLNIINDPEDFSDDPEIQAWCDQPWDGVSCIEIDTMAHREPRARAGDEKQALDLLERAAAALHKRTESRFAQKPHRLVVEI